MQLHTRQRGVALVIVLAMLVLLSGLIVAFMTSATTEREATKTNNSNSVSRQIADSTVNLVIGQIRDATTSTNEKVTWSSQPGAIRTYSGTQSTAPTGVLPLGATYYPYNSGADDFVFRLYSADSLRSSASAYSTELANEVKVIEQWDRKAPTADYVDLNEPILSPRFDLDATGKTFEPRYPIIDPRAALDRNNALAPAGRGVVNGFDAKLTFDANSKLASATGTSTQKVPYLPLPVKWLYVLRDGTIGAASLATSSNPIVGRTAFWVDDESCKLNINTASEGTFWDSPMAGSEPETGVLNGSGGKLSSSARSLSLAASQPARGEYQRYPGHPATTCLSPALGWLWGLTGATSIYPQNTVYRDFKEDIYKTSPFTPDGRYTSKGGTFNTDPDSSPLKAPPFVAATKHLYASVDEMMFQSVRVNPKGDSVPNPTLTPEALEKSRFFLTANSRAPEVNLFGRPRVTLWPIAENPDLRTPFDDLFAFTSTLGSGTSSNGYFLTRADAKNDMYDYKIPQNIKMYEYLQWLTGKGPSGAVAPEVPGFGGRFSTKYGDDCDQLLTETFDYMRSVNLVDTGTTGRAGKQFAPYTPRYYKTGVLDSYSRIARSVDWSGQVTPLKVPASGSHKETMGLGRFVSITEAALIFYRTSTQAAIAGSTKPALPALVNNYAQVMECVLAFEMGTTMPGFPAIRPTYYTKVIPIRATKVTVLDGATPYQGTLDKDILLVGQAGQNQKYINIANVSAHEVTMGRAYLPSLGFTSAMHFFPEHRDSTRPTEFWSGNASNPDADPKRNTSFTCRPKIFEKGNSSYTRGDAAGSFGSTVSRYPYVSEPIPIPIGKPYTLTIVDGGAYDVEIWAGESPDDVRSGTTPVQVVHLDFGATNTSINVAAVTGDSTFRNRFDGSLDGSWDCLRADDIVRSIEYVGPAAADSRMAGDLRMAAAIRDVPSSYFRPTGGLAEYNKPSNMLVHALTCSWSRPMSQGYRGNGALARGGNSRTDKPVVLPQGIDGVTRADGGAGDWDRGFSKHLDHGGAGNKVDEGNVKFDYNDGTASGKMPYFRGRGIEETGQSFFSPNRQLPSAVMLGSLPTGVKAGKPWQTLLFHPDRETGFTHPGVKSPPDHLWLDLFAMPVVEPYALGEPFSGAGKVNMNYVIAPFGYAKGESGNINTTSPVPRSYVRRDTALRGALKSTFIMAVPTTTSGGGHDEQPAGPPPINKQFRFPIDLDRTIDELEIRMNDQRKGLASRSQTLFRSASEICDIDLCPQDNPISNYSTFWAANAQTGDNMRERPYAHIYPRLTTKSNIFQVHMICQAIGKSEGANTDPKVFDPKRDRVLAEYRGSAMIERYIDPNDPNLAQYDSDKSHAERIDPYYRFRVIGTKQFAPF